MDLGLNKITSAASKYAELGGFAAGFLTYGIPKEMDDLTLLLSGKVHFPDVGPMIKDLFAATGGGAKTSNNTIMGIIGYIVGDALEGSGKMGQIGSILKKGSKGLLEGNIAQHVLFWSTHSSAAESAARGGSNSGSSGGSVGYGY